MLAVADLHHMLVTNNDSQERKMKQWSKFKESFQNAYIIENILKFSGRRSHWRLASEANAVYNVEINKPATMGKTESKNLYGFQQDK